MPISKNARSLIRQGVPPKEADLISRAIDLGLYRDTGAISSNYALRSIRRSIQGGTGTRGRAFRKLQQKEVDELIKVPAEQIAFGDLPDEIREHNSAFYYTMYGGNQARFIDRKQDETPEEYLDRPGKVTFNVTRLVISILSKLYHQAPSRELAPGTPEHIAQRLSAIWGGKLFNLSMLDADKLTRLVGTVAIRPMYDPTLAGGIRLWMFMSHQLRVIVDEQRPWEPAAVIERIQPFGTIESRRIVVWTRDSFVTVDANGQATYTEHDLGRIPHVFCKDERSYTSFFVEGRGRLLAQPNAVLNNDLTDLEEVKQMQGFGVCQLVNPIEDEFRMGPRQVFKFEPDTSDDPHGVDFKQPKAPIKELAEDCERGFRRILMTNGVPAAAVGAEIDKRSLSGNAIQAAMQPIVDDLEERGRVFEPIEWDLADSCLRIIRRHEPGFVYNPDTMKPEFEVKYASLTFPLSTRDQVLRDDFNIAQAKETPAEQMRRDNPDRYESHEQAVAQWRANLDEMASANFDRGTTDDLQASYGEAPQAPDAHLPDFEEDPFQNASLLDLADSGGLLDRG